MRLTRENKQVTRNDIQNMLNNKMPPAALRKALKAKGLSDEEVEKILNDLSSYR